MPLYTGVGDRGTTSLFDGTIVSKADGRVMAYGEVDELNAIVGLAHSLELPGSLQEMAITIQRDLFAVGARLADPSSKIADRVSKTVIDKTHVVTLERWIDELDGALPRLRNFILPGGCHAGAVLHHARVVCRRAERKIISLGVESLDPELVRYMNRLSDLLFGMARTANQSVGSEETEW